MVFFPLLTMCRDPVYSLYHTVSPLPTGNTYWKWAVYTMVVPVQKDVNENRLVKVGLGWEELGWFLFSLCSFFLNCLSYRMKNISMNLQTFDFFKVMAVPSNRISGMMKCSVCTAQYGNCWPLSTQNMVSVNKGLNCKFYWIVIKSS